FVLVDDYPAAARGCNCICVQCYTCALRHWVSFCVSRSVVEAPGSRGFEHTRTRSVVRPSHDRAHAVSCECRLLEKTYFGTKSRQRRYVHSPEARCTPCGPRLRDP